MVAKGDKSGSKSPCLNVRVELDNRALKAKNNTLTQAVAKLQQDNAELAKQLNLLQGESFEINSKYNNLKNVISIIDSTTKTCLPKLNEVVETFTGIIQLCSVAANISNFTAITSSAKKGTRTQAVKPQIVNGHILLNPTITLSRLSNEPSDTPPRSNRASNDAPRPSTSQESPENGLDRSRFLNVSREQDSDSDDGDNVDGNEEQNASFVCKANRRSRRNQSEGNADMSRLQEDFNDSDEENEEPIEEEESDEGQGDPRLTTIHEMEEEEEEILNVASPRARQTRFLQGRLQEVRIYLNQLPNTYIEQFRGTGNISISVSPPERRSSFKQRTSSLVGDVNESVGDNGRLYLEELNCSRMAQGGEGSYGEISRQKLSVGLNSPIAMSSPDIYNSERSSLSQQFSGDMSTIQGLQTPSTSNNVSNETNSMQSETLKELDMLHFQLQRKTSTPIAPRRSDGILPNTSQTYESPNRSKSDSMTFKSNITKRKVSSREKRKVAQVLLNRLSTEKRLSGSPIKVIEDIVNKPVIRKSSELKRSLRRDNSKGSGGKSVNSANSDEENVEKKTKSKTTGKRRKRDSPVMKAGSDLGKPKIKSSPPKNAAGRPKRAARPKTLKEPNLNKKMRRSK